MAAAAPVTRLTIVSGIRLGIAVPVLAAGALLAWLGPFKPSPATAVSPAAGPAVACVSKARPALAAAMARDIGAAGAGRSSMAALWVDAPGAGLTCSLNGSARCYSASTVQATILGALLRYALDQHRYLTKGEAALARAMISRSDDNAAFALWAKLGHPYLQHFLNLAGMRQTILGPGRWWGLTQVTAHDEMLLLRVLLTAGKVLDARSRAYELGLLAHGWAAHSLGAFTWSKGWYSIVVLTEDDPTMARGITTIEAIARAARHDLVTPQ